jgi:hypothetical protein
MAVELTGRPVFFEAKNRHFDTYINGGCGWGGGLGAREAVRVPRGGLLRQFAIANVVACSGSPILSWPSLKQASQASRFFENETTLAEAWNATQQVPAETALATIQTFRRKPKANLQ